MSWDGAIAAAVVGGLAWESGGWSWAIPLLLFFVTSSLLGIIFRDGDVVHRPRRAFQVIANGGAFAVCAFLFLMTQDERYSVAAIAGVAAANADTWATEIGTKFGKRFFRITTLESSSKGVSGVVSFLGLFSSFMGSSVIASTLPLVNSTHLISFVTLIGFGGALFDSILGDTIQWCDSNEDRVPRGFRFVNNDLVNLISVSVATFAGYFAAR